MEFDLSILKRGFRVNSTLLSCSPVYIPLALPIQGAEELVPTLIEKLYDLLNKLIDLTLLSLLIPVLADHLRCILL